FAHGLADAVCHEPSGLVGDLKRAVYLMRAETLLAGAQQVDRLKPLVQRHMAGLEHRADLHRELLAALAALTQARPRRLALQLIDPIDRAAVRAMRTFRPHDAFQLRDGGGLIVEERGTE